MKTHRNARSTGFTLVEVMIASAIAVFVVCAVGSAASACYQFYESMMADTELSLRGRELRDKLLFHEAAPRNGVFHTGMLSGTGVSIDTVALNMDCESVGPSEARGTRRMRLMLAGSGTGRHLYEEATRVSEKWLAPQGVYVDGGWSDIVDTSELAAKNRFSIDLPLAINVRRPFGSPAKLTRTEHITVPLFGKVQPTDTSRD